jgi:hypothetical protein
MILPEFMDWYLGHTAVQGQQTAQTVRPDRKDNLFEPVTDLHRTRGSFDLQAKPKAVILSGSLARAAIVSAGALFFFVLGAWMV